MFCNITTYNYMHKPNTCKRDHTVFNIYVGHDGNSDKNSGANGYNEPVCNKHFHELWQVQEEIWYLSIEIFT